MAADHLPSHGRLQLHRHRARPVPPERPCDQRNPAGQLIIYPATVGSNFTDIVLGLFRRSGLAINVIQQVNELQTALGLVASELGFTLVPEQVRRIQRDEIAYVSLAEDNITSPILCCRRKEPAVGHHAAGQRDP